MPLNQPVLRLLTQADFHAALKLNLPSFSKGSVGVFRVSVEEPKALGEDTRKLRFCFSDGSVDRMKDTISPQGWDTHAFMQNPVALFAHDSSSPPIGRASNVMVENDRLMGDIEFASADVYPFADTIYRLLTNRFLRAVSVGFLPTDYDWSNEEDREWGIDFKQQELLEISVVPVPANSNALGEARAKGIDTRPLALWAERILDSGDSFVVPRKELNRLRILAKEPTLAKPPRRDGMSETDPSGGGVMVESETSPVGNCGRAPDEECGMKDPAECSIHGGGVGAGSDEEKAMHNKVNEIVRRELARAIKTLSKADDAPQKPEGDSGDEMAEAFGHMKAAGVFHKLAMGAHSKALDIVEGLVNDDGEGDQEGKTAAMAALLAEVSALRTT
jgi:HK97 family phage prohead protease